MSAKHGNSYRSVRDRVAVFEELERRNMLSSVTLGADGILTLVGSDGNDAILVQHYRWDGRKVLAYCEGQYGGDPGFGVLFDLADIKGIRIDGRGGDDVIAVAEEGNWISSRFCDGAGPDMNVPATLLGGDGDDDLWCESTADSVVLGGGGDDWGHSGGAAHNTFGVEHVLLRDPRFTSRQSDWGYFDWNGREDQAFADPWYSPNHGGTYSGARVPAFDGSSPPDVLYPEPQHLTDGVSYTFDPHTGIVTIVGTAHADHITFYANQDNPYVVGYYFGAIMLADVKGIEVFAGGGDDVIEIAPRHARPSDYWFGDPLAALDIPVTVHGGGGDDEIYCDSTGDDLLYGDAGHDIVALFAGNDLFSAEQVDDYGGRLTCTDGAPSRSFEWADGGIHLFGNPWAAPVGGGTYYDLKGVVYPWGQPPPEPQPAPKPSGGEIKPYVPPAHEEVPAPIMPMATPAPMFSMKPIADDSDDLWD